MSAKEILRNGGKLIILGMITTLVSACTSTPAVNLPNEPRKFKIGKEAPESFDFFRSDEEIRGRLLAGTWKSRSVKFVAYTETALSSNGFKVSRQNSPLNEMTFTYVFSEDGKFTVTKAWKHTYAPEKFSGSWIVLNGALWMMSGGNELFGWEYYSVRFLDGKTMEMTYDDYEDYSETVISKSKISTEKTGVRVLRMDGRFFRDNAGNRYQTMKYETAWQVGSTQARRREKSIKKFSPFILELQ